MGGGRSAPQQTVTTSGIDELLLQITGNPHFIASTIGRP